MFNKENKEVEEKGATPYLDLPLDMESPWDATQAKARVAEWAGGPDKDKIDWAKYRQAFAWYDSNDPENFGSYKLPYADIVDGKLTAIWKGVVAVVAAVKGARGGVDIPDQDKDKVLKHMQKYYDKAGKEFPNSIQNLKPEEEEEAKKEEEEFEIVAIFDQKIQELTKKIMGIEQILRAHLSSVSEAEEDEDEEVVVIKLITDENKVQG